MSLPSWPPDGPADPPGYPPPYQPGPPQKRNSPLTVLLVIALLVSGVVVWAQAGRPAADSDTPAAAGPTSSLTAPPSQNPETPAESASGAAPRPRAKYQLEDHPLLTAQVTLPITNCELPKLGKSTEQLSAYYTAGLSCLDSAWGPALRALGLPSTSPQLDTPARLGDTPCGKTKSQQAVGLYCGKNQMIYMPTKTLLESYSALQGGHLATLAHEYGHHVQSLSGILYTAYDRQHEVGDETPAGLEVSRRLELQANCFAGLFLAATYNHGTVTKAVVDRVIADFRGGGGVQDHGSGATQGNWAKRGFDGKNGAACNTWTAKPQDVK